MIKKVSLVVSILAAFFILLSSEAYSLIDLENTPPASSIMGDTGGVLSAQFPKSNDSNPFGNQKGFNHELYSIQESSSVVYNLDDDLYYFFQWNYWNYQKMNIWQAYENRDELVTQLSTQDVLARINTFDRSLTDRNVVTDSPVQLIKYYNGNIYYLSGDVLWILSDACDEIILDLTGERKYIKQIVFSENNIYFTLHRQDGLWKQSLIETASEKTQLISEAILDFQVINDIVFYLSDEGVFQLTENKTTQLIERSDIVDFLIDGIIIYRDQLNRLHNAINGELISADVTAYNIFEDFIYYATEDGLFVYDLIEMSTEQLLTMDFNNTRSSIVREIQIYNEHIFMDITATVRPFPQEMNYFLVYDRVIKTAKPLIDVNVNTLQKYHTNERLYELYYPIGFIIQYDPGSFYSGYTLFSDPTSGVTIRIMNYAYYYPFDYSNLTGIEIKTDNGESVVYGSHMNDERFTIDGITENGIIIIAEGNIEFFDFAMSVFLEMVKSIKILE